MGKPVIGSNIGGIAELIDHENNGLLFDMGDINGLTKQINHLLKNPDDIVRLGRQARKKAVDEFSPLVHYKKIYSLYEQLIQNSANTKWAQN
jgi:glycosyltransferase involved in cell wall biosynthesis